MAGSKKTSVEDRIVSRLARFSEALKNEEPIGERFTCHKVSLDLQPESYGVDDVKQTRELLRCSQTLFAQFLGVSTKTVQAWEQGQNPPSVMACRFMDEIRNDPDHWRARLAELVSEREAPV